MITKRYYIRTSGKRDFSGWLYDVWVDIRTPELVERKKVTMLGQLSRREAKFVAKLRQKWFDQGSISPTEKEQVCDLDYYGCVKGI